MGRCGGWRHVWLRYTLPVELKVRLSQGHNTSVTHPKLPKPGPLALCHCAPGLFSTHSGRGKVVVVVVVRITDPDCRKRGESSVFLDLRGPRKKIIWRMKLFIQESVFPKLSCRQMWHELKPGWTSHLLLY